ncbi:MAG: hypothetical protein K0V04_41365 [Deltaproteobacteria bacterium]|nr:hypothetical protein [Deltaproteobacteria bacterium]
MSEPLPHDLPGFITRYRWRARLGTALAIMVIGISVGVGWYYFVRAPSPRAVCDHVDALRHQFPAQASDIEAAVAPMAIGGSERAVNNTFDQVCMWYFTTEDKQRSFFDYGRLARCVTFADDPRELFPCL